MDGRIKNHKIDKFVLDEIRNIRETETEHKCPYCVLKAELLYKVQSANNNVDVYNYYKCFKCDFIFLGDAFSKYVEGVYVIELRKNNYEVQDELFSNLECYKNPSYQFNYWLNEKKQINKLGYKNGRLLINKYPFNQLALYDHFYIYAQKVK